jgi:hypothetical protein
MPERLIHLTTQSGSHWTTENVLLWSALIACSLFAVVQFLTLFKLRPSDDRTLSRSFFLSLVMHCCCALGWVNISHMRSPSDALPGVAELPRVLITLANEEDANPEAGLNHQPVWTKSLERQNQPLVRSEPPEYVPSPIEQVPIAKEPTASAVPSEVPNFVSTSDISPPPIPQQAFEEFPTQSISSTALAADPPVVQARPESNVSLPNVRQTIHRPPTNADSGSVAELSQNTSDRTPTIAVATPMPPGDLESAVPFPKPTGAPDESTPRPLRPDSIPTDATDAEVRRSNSVGSSSTARQTPSFSRSPIRNSINPDFDPTPRDVSTSSSAEALSFKSRATASPDARGDLFSEDRPRPEIVRLDTPPVSSGTMNRAPETYRARRIEQRRSIALKNGGSEASERAVERSLKWLAEVQETDGRWSSSRHEGGRLKVDPLGQTRLDGGVFADSGVTGLAVLSFLGAGYTHEEGNYSGCVKNAVDWLIQQQQSEGYLGGRATKYDRMYCHAIATFALAEAYGMQGDPSSYTELRDALRRGVQMIVSMQNEDGGWRYIKGSDSDMSMFGWQLMALKSAGNAGVPIPEATRRGMIRFLQSRALGIQGGLAGYKLNDKPTTAMTAEALFCRQMFNVPHSDAASLEAVAYLRKNLPRLAVYDEYYWYYGTLAMFQMNGELWDEWNSSLRDTLIGLQRVSGPHAGSWDPNGKWAGIGGRIYSTSLSTMSLEVYYRFLRIYQTNN